MSKTSRYGHVFIKEIYFHLFENTGRISGNIHISVFSFIIFYIIRISMKYIKNSERNDTDFFILVKKMPEDH